MSIVSAYLIGRGDNPQLSLFILHQPYVSRAKQALCCCTKLIHEVIVVTKRVIDLFLQLSHRCGVHLVSHGDPVEDVVDEPSTIVADCGAPGFRDGGQISHDVIKGCLG